jgi:hypothetical protein
MKMTNDVFAETLENFQLSMWLISESQSRISDSSSINLRAKTVYDIPSLPIYCLPAKSNVIYSYLFIYYYGSTAFFWALVAFSVS